MAKGRCGMGGWEKGLVSLEPWRAVPFLRYRVIVSFNTVDKHSNCGVAESMVVCVVLIAHV